MVAYVEHHIHGSRRSPTVAYVHHSSPLIVYLGLCFRRGHWRCLTSKKRCICQKDPTWKPKYRCGPRIALAPSIPYKFLDVGTKMGCYKLREHIPTKNDTDNIYHPRFIRDAIPPVNTFHAVVHDRASRWVQDADEWCP